MVVLEGLDSCNLVEARDARRILPYPLAHVVLSQLPANLLKVLIHALLLDGPREGLVVSQAKVQDGILKRLLLYALPALELRLGSTLGLKKKWESRYGGSEVNCCRAGARLL